MKLVYFIFFSFLLFSCKENNHSDYIDFVDDGSVKIFEKKDSNISKLIFSNSLKETDSLNYFTYPYIYMGGGVAVGDINNDGLDDIFFTGNMVKNKLYLNKGNLVFEDISVKSNTEGDNRWYTGVTMADVNGDGWLDIYVSVAGQSKNLDFKRNELYINNRDLTFTESASKFGLDDAGQSVNATFFDYDNDGDLDVYVANYPVTPFQTSTYQYLLFMNNVSDSTTDHLYRNDGEIFTKVTKEAGVMQYNLSLSAVAADFNKDGWQDLYVSSDFNSPDSYYINNRDGTFSNLIEKSFAHTSFYGMGVDIADFNNDGYLDILQMDMDAASNRRSKANMASMNPQLFKDIKKAKFKTQFMQNSLQLQTAVNESKMPVYSEISRLAGVSSTDWSWGPLFADFDNDGYKDIFISNGTRREINNKDYFNKINKEKRHIDSLLVKTLNIPTEPVSNFLFKNSGDLTFKDVSKKWGISEKTFSNGCAYSDFDNDGDLDLVVNNIDGEVSLYENTVSDSNFLNVQITADNKNPFGLGSKISLFSNNNLQYQEITTTRGFQSSVSPKAHFGLGSDSMTIDSLVVVFPDLTSRTLKNISTNQFLKINQETSNSSKPNSLIVSKNKTLFDSFVPNLFDYKHKENVYDDFKYEVLLPHKTSNFGPGVSVGDLNGDGLDDVFVGAAASYPSGMFFQKSDGTFVQQKTKVLINDLRHEDMHSVIFDADNDGDNDIYIVSGGNEFDFTSPLLQDRLYVNDGFGNFTKSEVALPRMISSGSRAYTIDFDKDGDLDLFIGGRLVPKNYPYPANSYLLENVSAKGKPKFKNVTQEKASFFNKFGLVTSAEVADINSDGWEDLVVVGEWMPIKILINNKGKEFIDKSSSFGLDDATRGWWFSVKSADFDKDGDLDFIVGNLGENYKYKATESETFDIYFNDFDGNKQNDIVLSYYNNGEKYPVRGRECSSQQIPSIKKKFKDYDSFSTATLEDVYGSKLERSLHYQVKSFASIYLENKGGSFKSYKLPKIAQLSPVNQILINDFNNDKNLDILLAGNLYASEVETPRADAGVGCVLLGNSKGEFSPINYFESGLLINNDTKDMTLLRSKDSTYIVVTKNNDFLDFIKLNNN